MSNFFLLNEAIQVQDYESFKDGFKEFVIIDKEAEDVFLRHDSFWQIDFLVELYNNNYQLQDETAICKFIEQLTPSENYFSNSIQIDNQFQEEHNAFLGINFNNTTIETERQIRSNTEYLTFNHNNLWNVNYRNYWNKRVKLFPNLIMCGQVQAQINAIGTSNYFNQIIEKLKIFNEAIGNWKTGNFNHREINSKYALIISPESSGTMNRYGNERIFSLPNGGTEYFEFHIKTGDLRFHFYPNNATKEVYVGYIGPHLSTISN